MSYTTTTPRQLKDLILRRLGAPVINIEVTEEQIYDQISRALELYGEYHYSGLNKNYYIIKVSEEQAKTGLFELQPSIFAVQRILRTNSQQIFGMGGGTTYTWVSDFVNSIMGNNMNSGQCYQHQTLSGMGGNLQYYTQMMAGMHLMQDVLNPLPEYFYNSANKQLQVYKNFTEGDLLVIEAYTFQFQTTPLEYHQAGSVYAGQPGNIYNQTRYENPDKYQTNVVMNTTRDVNEQAYNNRWVKQMSTAYVKELWGQILSKHQGMSLPGGVTVDGNRLIQEAKEEIQQLTEELYQNQMPDQILWG